jgi:TRL-like protein family
MKASKLLAAPMLAITLTGCAMAMSPVTGFIYSDVKAPLTATSHDNSSKVGRAECTSILGLVAQGDASIQKAASAAGISQIHHVDYECWSILGFYAKFTVVVYGD